jgi:chemotaxis-related protein WspD
MSSNRTEKEDIHQKNRNSNCVELLLDRPIVENYKQEWTDFLIHYHEQFKIQKTLSVLVFRLYQDWLALPLVFLKEVISPRSIHPIPHRRKGFLLGIVNIEGRIHLCIHLPHLLQLKKGDVDSTLKNYRPERMIMMQKERELWVFQVDEIEGIENWNLSLIEKMPMFISHSPTHYLKGVMNKEGKRVGLLDEELLFYSIKRNLAT